MKVLLIQPPIEDFYITEQRTFPLGLLYIGSYLKKCGFAVEILDCITGIPSKNIPVDEDLKYIKDYYTLDLSPTRLFHNYYRFGYSAAELEKIIAADKFDFYCISSNFTAYYKTAFETAAIIKKMYPEAPVICGGYNAKIMYKDFLLSKKIDFIVFFQGERTLADLLSNIKTPEKAGNIAYLKNGEIIETQKKDNFNIDEYELDAGLLDTEKYKIGKDKLLTMMTARGCPFGCEFCTVNNNISGQYTRKKIEILKNEIKRNIDRYNIDALNIEDDNLGIDENYLIELCGFLSTEFPQLKLYCMNGLHYIHLNDKKIRALKSAGLKNLNISLVNINSDLINRKVDLNKLGEIIDIAHREEMNITVYFIIGLPEQTIEQIIEIILFLTKKNVVIGPSVFYPLPDMQLNRILDISNISYTQMRMTAAAIETQNIDRLTQVTILRAVRILNLKKVFDRAETVDFTIEKNNIISRLKLSKSALFNVLLKYMRSKKILAGVKLIIKKHDRYFYQLYEYKQEKKIAKKIIEMFF